MNIYHDERGRFTTPYGCTAFLKMSEASQEAYICAVKSEPKITKSLIKKGANLIGLKKKIKSPESTLKKLRRSGKGVSELFDIVRYTHIGDAENLVSEARKILAELKEEGHKVFRLQNSWNVPDNPYKGINVKMVSPDGQHYEIQFHTEESFDMKENTLHRIYEEAREMEEGSPQRRELEEKMLELSRSLTVPKGVEEFC